MRTYNILPTPKTTMSDPPDLPAIGGQDARPMTPPSPRRRGPDGKAVAEPGDNVPVKYGSRAVATPLLAAGATTTVLCCVAFCIVLGLVLNNDCGGAETRCACAPVRLCAAQVLQVAAQSVFACAVPTCEPA